MKLSIIIVNYNVEFFLEQCLLSVEKAMQHVDAEVIVVDNNSVDGSVDLVKNRFPWVQLIANKDNPGFSKANNQGIHISTGELILLLNPDTVVQEDTFVEVVEFMKSHPKAGGLGVKMVDGKGNFLPESKRGLPTPRVSFHKIFGLYRLFPRSKRFNWYYMGHLDKEHVQEVEILSGAFMLMRKEALDKVGLLDETFFMYGEDIDLSWRIIQGGYKNYYFPRTSIIHYKGESTKKGSLNYVFVFYNAMIIFAKKHFSEKNAAAFSALINMAIYFRAALSIVKQFVRRVWLPLLDLSLLLGSLFGLKYLYEVLQNKIYDPDLVLPAFVAYALVWLWSLYMSGGYDRPIRLVKALRGIAIGTVLILAAYSLLPESLRFSRALILLGAGSFTLQYLITRGLLHLVSKEFKFKRTRSKRFVLVGGAEETERVSGLLRQTNYELGELVTIDPSSSDMNNLPDIVRVYNIQEVIFCAKDMSSGAIISHMSGIDNPRLEFKIAPPESLYIIGSNSVQSSADIFIMDINSVSRKENRRKKRTLDVLLGLGLLVSWPITLFFVRKPMRYARNILEVLIGRLTWVGFYGKDASASKLPSIRPGVLSPVHQSLEASGNPETTRKLNVLYAKDYRVINDLNIVFRSFNHLGSSEVKTA